MSKTENTIHHDGIVSRKLEAILSPWSAIPKSELSDLMASVSVSVLELARRAGVSPQRVLKETPSRIVLNGQDFKVVKASKTPHLPNLRLKKLIRDSVKEPPIKGVRNGGMRLDEKVLERKVDQAGIERENLVFQATAPLDKDYARTQRREIIHARLADRFSRKSESQPTGRTFEPPPSAEIINLGPIVTRADIRSTLGPFEFAPSCEVRFPPEVIRALSGLVEEHARAFSRFIPGNSEGQSQAYQHCPRLADGTSSEPFFQVDIAGLSPQFLLEAGTANHKDVADILRGRIFEFEPSIAMYGLIQTLGGDGLLGIKFRKALDLIRIKENRPIVLLAPTKEKLAAMRATEFGKVGTQVLTPEEVRQISGFDALWGPDDFRDHLTRHQERCECLLYVRPSDPLFKLKDPHQKVAGPLFGHAHMREIIRENSITLNIDNPFWPIGDPRRIKDSKAALPLIGMGFRVDTINDVLARDLSPTSSFRAKPLQGVYGGYGQKTLNFSDRSGLDWLEEMLKLRGPYLIQPEIAPLVVIDRTSGESFAVIDRAFFSLVTGIPEFMGGIRILIPEASHEAQNGRLHGTHDMISAPII